MGFGSVRTVFSAQVAAVCRGMETGLRRAYWGHRENLSLVKDAQLTFMGGEMNKRGWARLQAQTVLHNWIRNLGKIQRHCKS